MNRYYRRGFGDDPQLMGQGLPTSQAINEQIAARDSRMRFILENGDLYSLPVSLGLAAGPPAAGSPYNSATQPADFDLVIIGAHATLRFSQVDIRDAARNRGLTQGPTVISAIASFTTSGNQSSHFDWRRPYFLPAKSILSLVTYADGTETGGNLVFICLQPPSYSA